MDPELFDLLCEVRDDLEAHELSGSDSALDRLQRLLSLLGAGE